MRPSPALEVPDAALAVTMVPIVPTLVASVAEYRPHLRESRKVAVHRWVPLKVDELQLGDCQVEVAVCLSIIFLVRFV